MLRQKKKLHNENCGVKLGLFLCRAAEGTTEHSEFFAAWPCVLIVSHFEDESIPACRGFVCVLVPTCTICAARKLIRKCRAGVSVPCLRTHYWGVCAVGNQ